MVIGQHKQTALRLVYFETMLNPRYSDL